MMTITEREPIITAVPEQALVDIPIQIRLSDCTPHQTVTLRAITIDGERKTFSSHAVFHTDSQGEIDVSSQKPISGNYEDVDSMGLFWSMTLSDPKKHAFFVKTKSTPLTVTITAEVEGERIASVDVVRSFMEQGVTKKQVEEEGLVGALYQPASSGPHPGVIILSGSDGGAKENAAAMLASYGFTAFALGYFGMENLPKDLIQIPLEYFESAIHWLQDQPIVQKEKIGVIGLSRGGELALLLGATYPEQIKAVVAGSPSAVMYAGLRNNTMPVSKAAWTYQGESLPCLKPKISITSFLSFYVKWVMRRPITNLSNFLTTLKDQDKVKETIIPLERIKGPAMLISGGDDQLWPSSRFAEMVIDRLKEKKHPYACTHLFYENAGHFLCFPYTFPYLPPDVLMSPGGGMQMSFGGNAKANAHAAVDSWPKMIKFLNQNLKEFD